MIGQVVLPRARLASARDEVERVLVLGFVAVRAASTIQAVIGVAAQSATTGQRSSFTLACLGGVAVESAAVAVWLCRRGAVAIDRWPLVVDTGAAVAALGAVATHTYAADRLTAWGMGVYAVSLSTAMLLGFVTRRFLAAVLGSAALGAYFFVVATRDMWGQWSQLTAAGTDAASYLGFACVSWVFARICRELAVEADQARNRVRELECQRARATVHELLPFLRPERITPTDEWTHALLVRQMQAKYRQMRAFVDGHGLPEDLDGSLRAVIDLHPQLSTRAVLDLDGGACLAPDVHECLVRAVDTALANVEQNAPEANVIVSAVSTPEVVVVAVHDDGPGFDPDRVRQGYGIAHVLGGQLEQVGGRARVESQPGKGTEVTIVVPREDPDGGDHR